MEEKVRKGRPKKDPKEVKSSSFLIRMTPDLKERFNRYCKDEGYSASLRITTLIERELKDNGYG